MPARSSEVEKNAEGAAGSTITTEIVVENAKVLSVGQGADERQTSPQVANSVTIEVTLEGRSKIALARNIGTLSLQLRSAGEGSAGKDGADDDLGLRRLGHRADGQTPPAALSTPSTKEPEGPKFKTVIVTRGLEPQLSGA